MSPLKRSSSEPTILYMVMEKMNLSNVFGEKVSKRGHTRVLLVFLALFFFTLSSSLFSRFAIQRSDFNFFYVPIKVSDSATVSVAPEAPISNSSVVVAAEKSVFVEEVWLRTESVLLPEWEVLVIVSPAEDEEELTGGENRFHCLFSNNATSPARFAGVLPFTNQTTFKCEMPRNTRRRQPFYQPVLIENPIMTSSPPPIEQRSKYMIRFNFFVYEAISTPKDVVLFVKGVNNRQGVNRQAKEFNCIFTIQNHKNTTTVKTAVTSSVQEVFRCPHPNLTASVPQNTSVNIKVSLQISSENRVVPSIAYYTTKTTKPLQRTLANPRAKKLLCACTMVYNVAKYLREWVTYYSKLGVEEFILYDNDSDDNLTEVVNELNREGFNVKTLLWFWPKTQEAGFSHNAVNSNGTCRWMMYLDVDEFVFAPSWVDEPQPSDEMMRSLFLSNDSSIGQVSFKCNDFGPSDQETHPTAGVTQGYTCHRLVLLQRHKSIVLLDAIDDSLVNAVHHFGLKSGYKTTQVEAETAVVNHYKYQAWSEFRVKFRRRVSAYVVDWRDTTNPNSNDRTPGLGFEAIEPKGWKKMFCDVKDERLKVLTEKWFRLGTKMVWERR